MKIEYNEIVKINNKVLYVSIPAKLHQGAISAGDAVKVVIEKGGAPE